MSRLTEQETEDLLRHGLEQIAARTPDAREVLEHLEQAGRPRSRPVGRLVAVAAAVIAVAVGVPVGVHLFTRQDTSQDSQVEVARLAGSVLQFRPRWLPDGFTEQYREVSTSGDIQIRRWRDGPAEIVLSAYSTLNPAWSATALQVATLPSQILVNGRVGRFDDESSTSGTVTWLPDRTRVLQVKLTGVPGARDIGTRIAESVRGDNTPLRTQLAFGPLPMGLTPLSSVAQGLSRAEGSSELKVATADKPDVPAVRVDLGLGDPPTAGTSAISLRGREGYYRDGDSVGVPVGDRWLVVSGPLPREDLIAIANGVVIDPGPDYSWIGRR